MPLHQRFLVVKIHLRKTVKIDSLSHLKLSVYKVGKLGQRGVAPFSIAPETCLEKSAPSDLSDLVDAPL